MAVNAMPAKVHLRMGRKYRVVLSFIAFIWVVSFTLIVLQPEFSHSGSPEVSLTTITVLDDRNSNNNVAHMRRDNNNDYDLVRQELERVNTKFYIYEDYAITQELVARILRLQGSSSLAEYAFEDQTIINAIRSERATLHALEKHPLRTRDPNEAELYIVPTPISELYATGCKEDDCKKYDYAFEKLRLHEIFQKTCGHNHVLISFGKYSFSKRYAGAIPALSRNYGFLENVTVATHYDAFASMKLASRKSSEKGFNYLFPYDGPVTKAISIGLGIGAEFEIQEPTMAKFQQSEYFVFYHSNDKKSFGYGSTRFRQALLHLDKERLDSFPPSSIGNDLKPDEWAKHFASSKFCLVIRGDTPHSHSLMFAIRAGCIPVVVSDYFEEYASPFRSSLKMNDYCVFVKEATFIKDAASVIAGLQNITIETIRSKLQNLAIAQSVVLPDHPNTLFVEAFLKEAVIANQRVVPSVAARTPIEITEDTVVISGMKLRYRFPASFSSCPKRSQRNEPIVAVGVLSAAPQRAGRFAVRNTWAEDYRDSVLFVVSGPWMEIQDEFFRYGDILWIDMPEEYLLLTYKTQLFFHMVETHVESYDYAMKADDDSYVGISEVARILSKWKPEYWGYCLEEEEFRVANRNTTYKWYTPEVMYPDKLFPPYAQGLGFALSRNFVKCAASKISNTTYLPWEDTSIGLLSRQCEHVTCRKDDFVFYPPIKPKMGLITVEHHVKTSSRMLELHWGELKKKKLREWVDKPEA